MLKRIFELLPAEYLLYKKQIEDTLLVRVRVYSDGSNYVGFSYDSEVSKKYEDQKARYFILKGIKVFDYGLNDFTDFQIHIAYGLLAGYSTPSIKRLRPNIDRINVESFNKEYVENNEFLDIAHMFTQSELELINPTDIYEARLKGKVYYHLKDLGNGDFIGMDVNKKIYQITHDPFEIIELKEEITEVLSSGGRGNGNVSN